MSVDFGLLHDATSHWVKELNTVMIRAVRESDCQIFKVPFSFKQVPGSFTGTSIKLMKYATECDRIVGEVKKKDFTIN